MAGTRITRIDDILARYRVSQAEFLERFDLCRDILSKWRRGKRQPGVHLVQRIERELGIPRWEFRPDVWPRRLRVARAETDPADDPPPDQAEGPPPATLPPPAAAPPPA